MKILSHGKKSIVVELTPTELDLIRSGITKEKIYRKKTWKSVLPSHPEELMYHFIMFDTAEQLMKGIHQAVAKYQEWKILK